MARPCEFLTTRSNHRRSAFSTSEHRPAERVLIFTVDLRSIARENDPGVWRTGVNRRRVTLSDHARTFGGAANLDWLGTRDDVECNRKVATITA